MNRSFLFVGANPARSKAARCVLERRRKEDERIGAPSHLVHRTRDECARLVAPARCGDEIGEEARRDAVLERVPDDRDADERAVAVGTEAAVVARGVQVAPVEVPGVAREVAAVAGGRARAQLVEVRAESLDEPDLEAVDRRRGRGRGAQSAALAGPPERVAHDRADPQRTRPETQPRQVEPAEPADEDRMRPRVRERHRQRRAGLGSRLLVLPLAASRTRPGPGSADRSRRSRGWRAASRRRSGSSGRSSSPRLPPPRPRRLPARRFPRPRGCGRTTT